VDPVENTSWLFYHIKNFLNSKHEEPLNVESVILEYMICLNLLEIYHFLSVFFIFIIFLSKIILVYYDIYFLSFLQNVKAYLRRATAREMLGYYKEAIEGKLHPYTLFYFLNWNFFFFVSSIGTLTRALIDTHYMIKPYKAIVLYLFSIIGPPLAFNGLYSIRVHPS
jgi:hypothetical protein